MRTCSCVFAVNLLAQSSWSAPHQRAHVRQLAARQDAHVLMCVCCELACAGELERYTNAIMRDSSQLAEQANKIPSLDTLNYVMECLVSGFSLNVCDCVCVPARFTCSKKLRERLWFPLQP